ncbi:MAG: hypothetical protein ACFFDN_14110 [Candidatus Hodarchaeota archaeon]
MKDNIQLFEFRQNIFKKDKDKGLKMPVLVVKFPEDNKKKVSMSRFLSNYAKREFSVIIDVEKENLSHIFEILNENDCKILIAQDRAVKVDYSTFFLLYLFNKKLKKEKLVILKEKPENDIKNGEIKEKEIIYRKPKLFELLNDDDSLKKMLNRFQKNSKLFFQKFENEFITTKTKTLYFDWAYRVRVLFDSITISAVELNTKLEELDKTNQLDNNFKLIFAIYSGYNNLGDIIKFTGLQDVNEVNKLEELIKAQIIHKNPYRLSETGQIIIQFINNNLKKWLSFKIPSETDIFLSEITNYDYTRQMANLLTNLSLLTIKNRIETGHFPFNEFQNINIDPNQL